MHNGSSDLLPVVLEETGGLGVDIVVDSGGEKTLQDEHASLSNITTLIVKLGSLSFFKVRLHDRKEKEEEEEERKLLPHKHDLISILGVGGHWVTSHKNMQVWPAKTAPASLEFLDVLKECAGEDLFVLPAAGSSRLPVTAFKIGFSLLPQPRGLDGFVSSARKIPPYPVLTFTP